MQTTSFTNEGWLRTTFIKAGDFYKNKDNLRSFYSKSPIKKETTPVLRKDHVGKKYQRNSYKKYDFQSCIVYDRLPHSGVKSLFKLHSLTSYQFLL